jgi:hypothetical protein
MNCCTALLLGLGLLITAGVPRDDAVFITKQDVRTPA